MTERDHNHHRKAGRLELRVVIRQLFLLALMIHLTGTYNLWGMPLSKTKTLTSADRGKSEDAEKGEEPEEERIIPGDRLCIRLEEDKDYGGIVTVSSTGYIALPLLNEIKVTDFVPSELADILKDALERKYFQKATVTVFTYDKNHLSELPPKLLPGGSWAGDSEAGMNLKMGKKLEKIYVVGEISRPGAITIPQDEVFTVGKAIIIAGGFTEFAKEKKVKLVRFKSSGEREVRIIDAVKVIKEGHLEEDVEVKDGDWVIVPQCLFKF